MSKKAPNPQNNDIRNFFKTSTSTIEKKPDVSPIKENPVPTIPSSKKRSIKEKVNDTKAGDTPKKTKRSKRSKSREKTEEIIETKPEIKYEIHKAELPKYENIIKKSKIIDDEDEDTQRHPKIEQKKKEEKKNEKPNLKKIDPKDYFGSTNKKIQNDKNTSPPSKKVSPKNSVTPEKTQRSSNKITPIKKHSKEDYIIPDEDENITTKNKKRTPSKGKKKPSDNDFIVEDEDSNLKVKSKKNTPLKKRKESLEKENEDLSSFKKTKSKGKEKKEEEKEDGVLSGKTIVLTGVLPVERNLMEDILKSLGAKCTKSVSKKTSYLVYGEKLEDGRPVNTGKKFQQAEKLRTKMMNFSELEDLLRVLLNSPDFDLANASLDNLPNLKQEEITVNPPTNPQMNNTKSYLKRKDEQSPIKIDNNNFKSNENKIIEDNKDDHTEEVKTESKILWTTKHTPKTMEEIIGNQAVVRKLAQWLNDWDDVVLRGNVKEQESSSNYYKSGKNNDNVNARAAIISGPPGIGKTSTVRLLAKLNNYKTFELNASDQRNKGIINQKVGYLMNNLTLSSSLEESNSKNLIIMDEIDGMAGNEDRGGISALIDIIKNTKVPIICICNDHQNQKLKTLIRYCYDLKFAKPDKRLVSKRLIEICKIEGFDVEQNAVEYLCESVGNDIRQCLNFLELWSRKSKEMKFKDLKMGYNKYQKDNGLMISNFSASQKLLNKNEMKTLRFFEKLALYFIDYDLIPLLIHENYLSCYTQKPTSIDMENIYNTADHISLGDVLDKNIRIKQDWNLLGNRGIHSCIAPSTFSANFIAFPVFPSLLGKMSKIRKINRQAKELKQCFPNSSLRTIKDEMVPLMLSKIVNIFTENGKEGIDNVISLLKEYKFSINLLKENLLELQTNDSILKRYEKLTPSLKSSLTKKYNECFKTVIKKQKKKESKEENVKYNEEGDVIEEIIEEGEEEEKEDEDEIVVKEAAKKTTKKTKK